VIVVTAGGVLVGLYLLTAFVLDWYPKGGYKALMKDPAGYVFTALPYLYGFAYGTLGILALGGLIGWAFDTALWVSNWLGDAAGWLAVGTKMGASATGRYLPLTAGGSWIMVYLTGLTLLLIRKRQCGAYVKLGTLTGATLGTWSLVNGFTGVPLAMAANWAGAQAGLGG
jgi:hypothetical protein